MNVASPSLNGSAAEAGIIYFRGAPLSAVFQLSITIVWLVSAAAVTFRIRSQAAVSSDSLLNTDSCLRFQSP